MYNYQDQELTEQIINCAFEVHNLLGSGFLEKVYENALLVELRRRGLKAETQYGLTVSYKENTVGEYLADVVVEDRIILELKALDWIR